MKRTTTTPPDEPEPSEPQRLVGFRTNEEWANLLDGVDALIREVEGLPDARTRERVLELLQGIDAIHREALTRLVRLFKQGVLEQVVTDPAIRTLMELYDLMPQPGAPDFITGYPPPTRGRPQTAIPQDRIADRVPIPHWIPALADKDDLTPGQVAARSVEDRRVLMCRVGDEFFALEAACARDGSALDAGTLSRYTLRCPNHTGCYYDVRNGKRIGAAGALECFPLRVDADRRVLAGFDMPFKPNLPSF